MSEVYPDNLLQAGPQGSIGVGGSGSAGVDGVSAYSKVLAAFTQPASESSVTIQVDHSDWMGIGQGVFVETGGYYEVVSTPSSSTVTLKNIGYSSNAASGSIIVATSKISPSGSGFSDIAEGVAILEEAITAGTTAVAGYSSSAAASAETASTKADEANASAEIAVNALFLTPFLLSANLTLSKDIAGYCIIHPDSDTTARVVTIPNSPSVAIPVGTPFLLDNRFGAGSLTVTPESGVTLSLVGSDGSSGSVVIASGGLALLFQSEDHFWRIGGAEVTAAI